MRAAVILIFCLFAPHAGISATLSLPGQTAGAGQILIDSLSFSADGQAVSGLQFDMDSDPGVSFGVLPGMQIGASTKILYTASLPTGALRVMIVGVNQATIADGEVLRPIILVDPAAPPGTAQIRISHVSATDAAGNAIVIASTAATVQIVAGATVQSFLAAGVVNAASLSGGPISPGEIVTIFGISGLAGVSAAKFNGTPGPILYAGPGQVNAVVPFGLDASAAASLELVTPQGSLGTVSLPAAPVAPALFTQASGGTGPGAILNQDYTVNSFSNPAAADTVIMLYGTGFGALNPPAADGQPATGQADTVLRVTASVGGIPADVTYAGAAPGLVAGVVQINVRVPASLPANPAAPVVLHIGSVASSPGVTVSTR